MRSVFSLHAKQNAFPVHKPAASREKKINCTTLRSLTCRERE